MPLFIVDDKTYCFLIKIMSIKLLDGTLLITGYLRIVSRTRLKNDGCIKYKESEAFEHLSSISERFINC